MADQSASEAAEMKSAAGEEHFPAIADEAPAILWVTDATGYCTYLNKQWYTFTGQGKADALGFGWTDAVHPEDRKRTSDIFLAALRNREPFELDYRLCRHDGVYRYAVDAGRPRFSADGTFLGYVGFVLDITERKELETALLQAQKMDAVGRLAGGIAHDFNNLLTAISGHAHLIAEQLGANSLARQDLAEIEAAVQRASALTKRLLAFSRQQMLRPEVLDLNTTVREAERMFSRIIGEDIELRLHLAPNLPPIRADRSGVDQVVLNLMVNAREAMPRGGVIEISTNIRQPSDESTSPRTPFVTLAVRDTGMGMDDRTKQHLFEPFFTTKPEGTGLGLATVYGIVRQSAGEIHVDSEPGAGSVFTLSFPATTGEPRAAEQHATAPVTGSGKILLVEDEPAVRDVATRALAQCGYEVVSACTAADAMEKLAAHHDFRLVISDIVMPGGTGLELARHVTRFATSTRMLLMSGYPGEEMARRGSSPENYAFVQKPFTAAELARAVSEVLAK